MPENRQMTDEFKTTVRIQRPARIQADGRDRSVRAEPVEIAEFELLSTVALKKILKSNDESAKKSITAAANCGDQGVLARDIATGHFEILDDADLQRIIEQDHMSPNQDKAADIVHEPVFDGENSIDELSLVKTLALKKNSQRRRCGRSDRRENRRIWIRSLRQQLKRCPVRYLVFIDSR